MYYKLKKENPKVKIITNAYEDALKKCFYSYITKLRNENYVDLGHLKRLWGKIWIKEKTNSDMIIKPTTSMRDTYNKKRKEGIDTILSFHDLMTEINQFPVLINKLYSVSITNNITLTGTWEYIREIVEMDENIFQILKFNIPNDKFQTIMQMSHDLELTAAYYAFKKLFNDVNAELVYVNLYKKKMITSYRNEKDFDLLRYTVTNAVKGITNNIICVSPDKRCYHCEYRNECEKTINMKKEVIVNDKANSNTRRNR